MLQCYFLSPQVISEVLRHITFLLELNQTILTVDKIKLSYPQLCPKVPKPEISEISGKH